MAMRQMKRKASVEECERKKRKNELYIGQTFVCLEDEYVVTRFLARGTFGQVYKCREGSKVLALKYLEQRHGAFEEREVKFLGQIKRFADDYHLLRLHQAFYWNDHLCIVLEYLDISLHKFLKGGVAMPVSGIRVILSQLLSAVDKLKACNIIHSDIKPENIMMVDRINKPFNIKLVDFGCAIELEKYRGTVLRSACQTRWYRAPENILGLPCSEKMDVWSVGCVAAECMLMDPLYPGLSDYNMLQLITETQGIFSNSMLTSATKVRNFFREEPTGWQFMTPEEAGEVSQVSTFDDLQDLTELVQTEDEEEQEDVQQLVILIKALLEYKEEDRISAGHALNSNFITLSHLKGPDSPYYQASAAMMRRNTVVTRRPFSVMQVI